MGWYTYYFVVKWRIVHGGITRNPRRREAEHRRKWPNGFLRIVGGPMTEAQARHWERTNGYS